MKDLETGLIKSLMEIETWMNIAEQFGYFGPLFGILIPIIEAFIPVLPLSAFVTLNIMMFGPVLGYVYSLIGTCIGSVLIFKIVNRYKKNKFEKVKEKYKLINNASNWVKRRGGFAVFILLCFPFTPTIAVAVLAALSGMRQKTYIKALMLGKVITVLQLSVVGYNIFAAIKHPVRLVLIVAAVFVLYILLSKLLEKVQKLHNEKQINMD